MGSLYDRIKESEFQVVQPSRIGGDLYSRTEQTALKREISLEQPTSLRSFPSTIEMLEELQIDPLSLKANPTKILSSAFNTLKETIKTSAPKIANLFKPQLPAIGISGITRRTPSEEIGEKLEATAAVAHLVFAPISALFEGANEVPVLGSVSRLISLPFVVLGEAGANLANNFVTGLPISQEAKDNIRPGMEEIFALAGQLAFGKASHIGQKKILPSERTATKFREAMKAENPELVTGSETIMPIDSIRTNTILKFIKEHGEEKAKEIITKSLEAERQRLNDKFGEKDATTIVNKANEMAEQANEPVPKEIIGEAPIILKDISPQAKMGDIAAEAQRRGFEVPEFGVESVEPKPKRKFVDVPREQLPVRMEQAEKGISRLESRMKGLFETKNVKAAKAEAEARGLDVSIYDKMNKSEQIRNAARYVERTPQRDVLEVLEGKREAPRGLLNNAIMLALEEKSLRSKNIELAIKLASLRSTRMGQEISILTEVAGISPVSGMHEIIRARQSSVRGKLKQGETIATKKSKTIGKISQATDKTKIKMAEAEKILTDITC